MCGSLDHYLKSFSRLRVDKNSKSWPQVTLHKSPYKPFLLLSILDHIESGRILRNFISPSFELTETFLGYIALLPQMQRTASMSYPFYYLQSSDFWHLVPQTGEKHLKDRTIKSMVKLRKLYLGARFSDNLYPLLQMQTSRDKLRNVLIQSFFAPEFQSTVRQQSYVNCASDSYSNALLHIAEPVRQYSTNLLDETSEKKIRDQGFRKAVVHLYDHRCALCGIKMLTPEGHTVVDAAHIIPWSKSQNDHPTNGMALCKLCHWSFDEGLMSVDTNYHVIISPAVKKDNNLPGHIMTLSDRPIFRPEQSKFWPDLEGFIWHRKERFRRKG